MNNQQVSQLIEQVIYLTSLISRPREVEQFKDTLSMITARWNSNEQMAESDQDRLKELDTQIKMYLVTQDPLRSFTLESLEKRLNASSDRRSAPKISAFGTITMLSLCVGLIAFAVSFPLDVQGRALLCVSLFFLALHIGIAWLYLSALKNFRSAFRQSYVYISASAIALSIGFTHYALINLLKLDRYPLFQYGGFTWLIALPFILMFLGLRPYVRLLQIKTIFSSLPLAGCATMALGLVMLVIPHRDVTAPFYYHFWTVGAWAITLFALLSGALAGKIKRSVTAAYSRSMTWLYYYALAVGLGSIGAAVAQMWTGGLYGEKLAAVIAFCGIVPQLAFLYAAYSFKKETSK